jgi:hypothetical protein
MKGGLNDAIYLFGCTIIYCVEQHTYKYTMIGDIWKVDGVDFHKTSYFRVQIIAKFCWFTWNQIYKVDVNAWNNFFLNKQKAENHQINWAQIRLKHIFIIMISLRFPTLTVRKHELKKSKIYW